VPLDHLVPEIQAFLAVQSPLPPSRDRAREREP